MWTKRAIVVTAAVAVTLGCKGGPENAPGAATSSGSAAAANKPPEVIRFVAHPVEVGQKWKTKRQTRLSVSVEFWTETTRWGVSDSLRDEKVEVTDEVLARVGGRPGRVKATYAVHRLKEDHPDRGKREDAVLEGRTFILDAMGETPVATDGSGKAVSEPEAQSLWLHHPDLGKDDPIVKELVVRPYRVGEKRPLRVGLAQGLLGTTAGEYKSGDITLTRIEGTGRDRVAELKWTAALQTKEENGMITDWDLKGTSRIRVQPAHLVSQQIEASLAVSGRTRKDGTWLRIQGDGYMKDAREVALDGDDRG